MSILLKRASFALLLLFGLTFGGIVNAQMGEEPKKDEAKKLDLPWSAEDCKKSWKNGGTFKFSYVMKDGDQEQTMFMVMAISDVNDKGYKTKTEVQDKDGKALSPATEETKTWDKWAGDFDFTDKDTTVTDGKVKVAAGEYDCKVYTQTKEKEGVKSVTTFYFVKDKAGWIVKVSGEETKGDKKSTTTMELVEAK